MKEKFHLYLSYEERSILVSAVNQYRNQLLSEGRYTDVCDELLVKLYNAKIKRLKVVNQ